MWAAQLEWAVAGVPRLTWVWKSTAASSLFLLRIPLKQPCVLFSVVKELFCRCVFIKIQWQIKSRILQKERSNRSSHEVLQFLSTWIMRNTVCLAYRVTKGDKCISWTCPECKKLGKRASAAVIRSLKIRLWWWWWWQRCFYLRLDRQPAVPLQELTEHCRGFWRLFLFCGKLLCWLEHRAFACFALLVMLSWWFLTCEMDLYTSLPSRLVTNWPGNEDFHELFKTVVMIISIDDTFFTVVPLHYFCGDLRFSSMWRMIESEKVW